MNDYAIKFENINYSISSGFFLRPEQILHDINLEILQGTVVGLVGPNGAGKTTTIKLGAGLLKPESGEVRIFGRNAGDPDARLRIGVVTETQYAYPFLKLEEWLRMLCRLSGVERKDLSRVVDKALELLGLQGCAKKLMNTLSKGQLQRAGIAQAFAHDPDILFLDEPMSGLDPYWRCRINSLIQDFKLSGRTVLFSSHILSDVERLSDMVVLLERGRLIWKGRLSELQRDIVGYEVVCKAGNPSLLRGIATDGVVMPHPEGGWAFTVPSTAKDNLLQMVADGSVRLDYLAPLHVEIEKLLFQFSHTSHLN